MTISPHPGTTTPPLRNDVSSELPVSAEKAGAGQFSKIRAVKKAVIRCKIFIVIQ